MHVCLLGGVQVALITPHPSSHWSEQTILGSQWGEWRESTGSDSKRKRMMKVKSATQFPTSSLPSISPCPGMSLLLPLDGSSSLTPESLCPQRTSGSSWLCSRGASFQHTPPDKGGHLCYRRQGTPGSESRVNDAVCIL